MAGSSGILSQFSLSGTTVLFTGATRGLGQGMALGLAEAGADLILAQARLLSRDPSNTETKTKIEALGRSAHIYSCDFSSPSSVTALLPALLADNHLPTVLVNCAGIQRRHPAARFPDADWNDVLQVNLSAVFSLSRDFGAYLLDRPAGPDGRRGAIVNIASIMSYQGGVGVPAYAAAKGGVAVLTKSLSNEWAGQGINVNAIAPGYVATDMTEALASDPERGPSISARIPMGRWGTPEDFKGVVVWLASRASVYVNGETVNVDGGWMGR